MHIARPCIDNFGEYFAWSKGTRGIADFLAQCNEAEMPAWTTNAANSLRDACSPPPSRTRIAPSADGNAHPEANAHGPD